MAPDMLTSFTVVDTSTSSVSDIWNTTKSPTVRNTGCSTNVSSSVATSVSHSVEEM